MTSVLSLNTAQGIMHGYASQQLLVTCGGRGMHEIMHAPIKGLDRCETRSGEQHHVDFLLSFSFDFLHQVDFLFISNYLCLTKIQKVRFTETLK
jgi:hypothetical protein